MAEYPDIDSADRSSQVFDQTQTLNVRRVFFKMGGVVVFIALCVIIIHFTPLKAYLTDLRAIKHTVLNTGFWAPLVYFLVSAVAIFVGAPRLPFCILGGMLFGFVLGLALSQMATLAGAYGPFLFARYATKSYIVKKLKRFDKIAKYLENPTVLNVFLIRQLPIWGVFTNLFFGSLGLSHTKFIVGSLLGFLPQAAIFTLIGSGIVEESLLRALSRIWMAVPILIVGAFLSWRFLMYSRQKRDDKKKESR